MTEKAGGDRLVLTFGGQNDGDVTFRVSVGHQFARILDEDLVDANQLARNNSLKKRKSVSSVNVKQ